MIMDRWMSVSAPGQRCRVTGVAFSLRAKLAAALTCQIMPWLSSAGMILTRSGT